MVDRPAPTCTSVSEVLFENEEFPMEVTLSGRVREVRAAPVKAF